jgi:hypothetical protein
LNVALSQFWKAILCRQTKVRFDSGYILERLIQGDMQSHSAVRDKAETLAWLAWRQGTICLWRIASHVATATTDSVRRRFYRFFQHVGLDGAMTSQVFADLLGIRGKAWTLSMDPTNWEFG